MAQSPAHKFGQIIGDLLELVIRPSLAEIAIEHNLYLDYKHARRARGGKRKVVWKDSKGNEHDLDYVLEESGSEIVLGSSPKAFIEIAWRRYTKHSRNKAQEIQGAIVPLAETYSDSHPFLGVVLAGVFTNGSLAQLSSHGFQILYYPYESVVAAFGTVGLDARYDEKTSHAVLQKKVKRCERLSRIKRRQFADALRDIHKKSLDEFLSTLRATLNRRVKSVYVIPLHGVLQELGSVEDAIAFLRRFDESAPARSFVRYEVNVRYTNEDEIRGMFRDRADAISFLQKQT